MKFRLTLGFVAGFARVARSDEMGSLLNKKDFIPRNGETGTSMLGRFRRGWDQVK